jgi:protein-serine/threonine kinase
MLSAAVDLAFDDDDWKTPGPTFLYKSASVNSWGVTSIGRGFHWAQQKEEADPPVRAKEPLRQSPQPSVPESDELLWGASACSHGFSSNIVTPYTMVTPPQPPMLSTSVLVGSAFSPSPSPPLESAASSLSNRTPLSRSPSSPRCRRRSSQQRVSLVAGRVLIAPIEPPSPPPMLAPSLHRAGSMSSFLSAADSVEPPTPFSERESFLGNRSISDFVIEGEIGRGAYGLVKRGREIQADGSLGVRGLS